MSSSQSRKQKFEIGDCVETSKGEKCIIRYIGKVSHTTTNRTLYGIEYIDGTIGEHNGRYKGRKYFLGLHKRCSFIKYDQIRRKTKYFKNAKNHRNYSAKALPKMRTHLSHSHSNHIFTQTYTNSKRKSLPTKLNAFNDQKRSQNRRKTLDLKRRASNPHKNGHKNDKNRKIRAVSMQNALRTRTKTKTNKKRKNPKSVIQKRKNATANLTQFSQSRSKSISPKQTQTKDKRRKSQKIAFKKRNKKWKECSQYTHERIHFSEMHNLDMSQPSTEKSESPKRKNAFPKIVLSQDSLKEYHSKRNLVIGDLCLRHKYLLKNGVFGICLFVGALHCNHSVENEYIGLALLNGKGRHDGQYKGKRYFECRSQCGLFAKRNKLWKDCGPASEAEIEQITRQRRRRHGGLLYDTESDISDLSENNMNGSDSEYSHSGHSDFESETNETGNESEIVSYIDLFSPQTPQQISDEIITPKQYYSDIECETKSNKNKKIKTKKKIKNNKSRQSRSVKQNISVFKNQKKTKKKSEIKTPKSCKSLRAKMEKFGFKTKKSKKMQSQTQKVSIAQKIPKRKRMKRANTLEDSDGICNIETVTKPNKKRRKNWKKSSNVNLSQSTNFSFQRNAIGKSENQSLELSEASIDYSPVSAKKRSRRNATPIVSIPHLVGTNNFLSFLNESNDERRNDRNDLRFSMTGNALTPLGICDD